MHQIHNHPTLKFRRRELRRSLTPAEAALWSSLQRSQLGGKKFRRQHSVGPYILDFYCPECRLAVELDGQTHFNPKSWKYDGDRTGYLNKLNIRVLRFENRDVFEYGDWVLLEIAHHLNGPGGETNRMSGRIDVALPEFTCPEDPAGSADKPMSE